MEIAEKKGCGWVRTLKKKVWVSSHIVHSDLSCFMFSKLWYSWCFQKWCKHWDIHMIFTTQPSLSGFLKAKVVRNMCNPWWINYHLATRKMGQGSDILDGSVFPPFVVLICIDSYFSYWFILHFFVEIFLLTWEWNWRILWTGSFLKPYLGMLCLSVNHVHMRSYEVVLDLLSAIYMYRLVESTSPDGANWTNQIRSALGPCDFVIQFWRHEPLWSRMMQQGINSFFRGFKWVPHTSYTIHGQIFINFSITCLLVIHWLWMGDLYTQTTDGYNMIKSSTAIFLWLLYIYLIPSINAVISSTNIPSTIAGV